jgi:hypothetical protein
LGPVFEPTDHGGHDRLNRLERTRWSKRSPSSDMLHSSMSGTIRARVLPEFGQISGQQTPLHHALGQFPEEGLTRVFKPLGGRG